MSTCSATATSTQLHVPIAVCSCTERLDPNKQFSHLPSSYCSWPEGARKRRSKLATSTVLYCRTLLRTRSLAGFAPRWSAEVTENRVRPAWTDDALGTKTMQSSDHPFESASWNGWDRRKPRTGRWGEGPVTTKGAGQSWPRPLCTAAVQC